MRHWSTPGALTVPVLEHLALLCGARDLRNVAATLVRAAAREPGLRDLGLRGKALAHDHFTDEQVRRFMEMYNQISDEIKYKPMRHVLNSSGITRHPNYHFEMVRLGIGLYGIDSNGAFQNQLQVVQTLKASISQIKNVPQNETIGYSRRGVLKRDSRIATISIGYADGLLRGAGNGQFSVYLHGQRAPIVGSVCMDMTMIDVTDILEATEGDDVEIFGSHLPVQALAKVLNTIPYEIFTGISERVKRVYFQE